MFIKIIAFAIVLCFSVPAMSQSFGASTQQLSRSTYDMNELRKLMNTRTKNNTLAFRDIKGTPYLSDKFALGEFFINDKSYGNFNLRYNIYNDQIEILSNDSFDNLNDDEPDYDAFLKTDNSKVVLNGKTIKSYFFNDENGNSTNSYFIEVNSTDKYILLLRKRCVLTPAEKAATPNQADRAAKFTIYDDYYILDRNEIYPMQIELNKRKFLKAFPKMANALKDFIKKEDINLKQEEDLVQLTNYMSTL
ncbi:MAG: hypothetical protein WA775_09035 [Psychroserpens sp.]|uniref:hypothetical protein n=1 Tax=Psychroserpens sp. TaxID=2020870 RepID=UPI003C775781